MLKTKSFILPYVGLRIAQNKKLVKVSQRLVATGHHASIEILTL